MYTAGEGGEGVWGSQGGGGFGPTLFDFQVGLSIQIFCFNVTNAVGFTAGQEDHICRKRFILVDFQNISDANITPSGGEKGWRVVVVHGMLGLVLGMVFLCQGGLHVFLFLLPHAFPHFFFVVGATCWTVRPCGQGGGGRFEWVFLGAVLESPFLTKTERQQEGFPRGWGE